MASLYVAHFLVRNIGCHGAYVKSNRTIGGEVQGRHGIFV